MEYKYATFFKFLQASIDYLILNLWIVLSLVVLAPHLTENLLVSDFRFHVLVMNLLWFVASANTKLYERILNTEAVPMVEKTIWTLVLFGCAPSLLAMAVPNVFITANVFWPYLLILASAVLIWKVTFLLVRKSQRRFWVDYKKVVVLGSGATAREILEHFDNNANSGYMVMGFFCDQPPADLSKKFRYLGRLDQAVSYSSDYGVSEIFSALPADRIRTVKSLMQEADKNLIRFKIVPDLSAFIDKNVLVDYYGSLPVLSPRKEPLEVRANELMKQAFDYVFAALAIVFVLSWMTPLIALAIKLDSRGPIFFRQLRSGKDNKPFFCLKFRSMYVNDQSDLLQATKNDKRITRVGAFLRRTSLDELPQFFNVIMGDMSIVGPRPHMLKHTEDYSEVINDFMVRQFMVPGITGWAQVNGLRGETKEHDSMSKRVKADLWYMENWSLLLDFKIVFLTMIQSLKRNQKAY